MRLGSFPGHARIRISSVISNIVTIYRLEFDGSTAAVGELNKDGNGDVIVGVSSVNTGRGEVQIFLGGNGPFDTTADAILSRAGAQASDLFGWALGADDANNDGIDDVIVGVRLADNGAVNNGEVQIFVLDFVPPEITVPADIVVTASSSHGSVVTYSVTATDQVDGSVSPSCAPPSGETFAIGTHTVTCTAADSRGNTASASFKIIVKPLFSGALEPINSDGSSIFRVGQTVPVRLQLSDSNGNFITDVLLTFEAQKISNSIAGDETESLVQVTATAGDTFRYDADSNQYIYNWSTKGLSAGTWEIRIYIDFGQPTELLLEDADGSKTEIVSLKSK